MNKWANIKSDFGSGIVVFFVAIPLCLGIALASGAPVFSGLIGGIIGGIIVGAISQSNVSVSGPANGMIVIVLAGISDLGGFNGLLLALMFAGIAQIIIGLFKAGFIADYIPSNVIQGLMAAIGILIIIKQLPLAFGFEGQTDAFMSSLKSAQESFSLKPLLDLVTHINTGASVIAIISIIIMVYWQRVPIKALKIIPAPIIAVLASVLLNEVYLNIWPSYGLTGKHLVNMPVIDSFRDIFNQIEFPNFSIWTNPKVYFYALTITIIASLETLLSLEAAEKMDKKRRYCSRNRELIAQGIGNTLSGLIGGIPITSVIIRSSVNVQSGAKTKLSTMIHGFLILISLAAIPEWLNLIPLSCLAAILIFAGYKLSSLSLYRYQYNRGYYYFFPFIVTTLAIIFTNLFLGIVIGISVSAFFILKYSSQRRIDIIKEKHSTGDVLRLALPQQLTFLNKASFLAQLKGLPNNSNVVIDASSTDFIDHDLLEIIEEFKQKRSARRNITLNLHGFSKEYKMHDHVEFIDVTTPDAQKNLDASTIIEILQEGNQRFRMNRPIHRQYNQQIKATAASQHPMAIVLGCIDSRVPVELIFDTGVGELFSARVAGNVINNELLGSMEFACKVAGAKMILVMGHTSCGAIKAACDAVDLEHVNSLVKKIKPSIDQEKTIKENRNGSNEKFVNNVTKINIENVKKEIYEKSKTIRGLVDKKEVTILGAIYDVRTGKVFFDKLSQ